jgi:Domain of unknown function (DUF4177)
VKVYKVITQRDEFFRSKFNPEALEQLLNVHAAQGWHVVSVTATDVGSFFGSFWAKGGGSSRQELVVFLEREVESHEKFAEEQAQVAKEEQLEVTCDTRNGLAKCCNARATGVRRTLRSGKTIDVLPEGWVLEGGECYCPKHAEER